MLNNTISALVLTAGLLQGGPPGFPLPRELPPRVLALPLPMSGCLSPGEARAAVQNGQVIPLSSLLGQIRQSAGGEIVSAPTLCSMGGRLVYFLDVLTGGRIVRLQVDGQSGRIGY